MQTKTILSAILATISYLEAVEGAPMSQSSDSAIDWSSLPHDTLFKPVDLTTVDKRKTSAGSILTSALKSGGLSALESGAEDIWDDFTGSDDSTSSKRSLVSSLFKEVPTLINGFESLTDDDDSSSSSKRSLVSSLFKEVPTLVDGFENLIDDDSSSSSKRSWASLLDKAEPYIASGAESIAKTVGGAVGSEVVSAGQSLASDVGISKRKINWGNILESGATAGASAVGSGLGTTVADGFETLASDVGINVKERSATFDAELPKRTGIWTEIEHGLEDVAPIAIGALADVKRSNTISADMPKRSGIWTEIEHGIEDIAPMALGALADAKRSNTISADMPKRSGIWTEIEHGIEDVAPFALSALADAKRDNVRRSFLDDLESFLGNLKSKRDTTVPRSFEDELESFLSNL